MTIHIEGSHTSGCCDTQLVLEEKSETVDDIGLPCTSCAGNNHSERWWIDCRMLTLDDGVDLQLVPL